MKEVYYSMLAGLLRLFCSAAIIQQSFCSAYFYNSLGHIADFSKTEFTAIM